MLVMMMTSGSSAPAKSVSITDTSSTRTGAGIITAYYEVNTDGSIHKPNISGADSVYETWLVAGTTSDFEVRATVSSGATPTGASVGSWLATTTTRRWTLTDSVLDASSVDCTLLVEIRDASSLTVLDSATITISAQRTS